LAHQESGGDNEDPSKFDDAEESTGSSKNWKISLACTINESNIVSLLPLIADVDVFCIDEWPAMDE
jgi:hypothetical protein